MFDFIGWHPLSRSNPIKSNGNDIFCHQQKISFPCIQEREAKVVKRKMAKKLSELELVFIDECVTESGIAAEYAYINEKYGPFLSAWTLLLQTVTSFDPDGEGEKQIDILKIQLKNGEIMDIAFDISAFYGR